jgi:hypothetical protein
MSEIIHLYVPYEINPNGAQGTFVTPCFGLKSVIIQSNTPDECYVLFLPNFKVARTCTQKREKSLIARVLHQQLLSIYGQNDCSH